MATVSFFEIPADDLERAKKFYTELFQWQIAPIPMGDQQYWMFTTGEQPPTNAGLIQRQMPGQQITNYITVASVDEYAAKVENLGGKILVPKMAVPGMGFFVVCADTEGNSFAIWEDNQDAK